MYLILLYWFDLVINSKNLEPGNFPDANGDVEEEEDDQPELGDILYEQTVEHLSEKGLKPSEEIEVCSTICSTIIQSINVKSWLLVKIENKHISVC